MIKSESSRHIEGDLGIVDIGEDRLNEALANSNWNKNNRLYAEILNKRKNYKHCELCKNFKPY